MVWGERTVRTIDKVWMAYDPVMLAPADDSSLQPQGVAEAISTWRLSAGARQGISTGGGRSRDASPSMCRQAP